MFSVPGKYSGGEAERFTWTQTLTEVELRAPLPPDLPTAAVKCTFRARCIEASWTGAEIKGELTDAIAVDDCLWVIERDDAPVLVATMRKAAPRVWTKLFETDPEPEEAPKLLDGLAGRSDVADGTKTKSKEEMLREAKRRAAVELNGPSQAKLHTVEGRKDEVINLAASEMPQLAVSRAHPSAAPHAPNENGALPTFHPRSHVATDGGRCAAANGVRAVGAFAPGGGHPGMRELHDNAGRRRECHQGAAGKLQGLHAFVARPAAHRDP
jgi:hypothetical protein